MTAPEGKHGKQVDFELLEHSREDNKRAGKQLFARPKLRSRFIVGAGYGLSLIGCLIHAGCEPLGSPPPVGDVPKRLGSHFCSNISDSRGDACCPKPAFYSERVCEDVVVPFLDASLEAAVDAGLEYSSTCLEKMLLNSTCPDEMGATFLPCEEDCQVLFGDKPEGADCEAIGHRMSDCQQGLVCDVDRTCHDPCALSLVSPEGGYCGPERGMWYVVCDAGLACDVDGTCQPAAALGEVCGLDTACAVDGWCDTTNLCVAKFPGGSACDDDAQCASEICKQGECYEPGSFACGRSAW